MNFTDLNNYMQRIGNGETLSQKDKKLIAAALPAMIEIIRSRKVPARIKLPTGETSGSATRLTALKCHCLLLVRKAFGPNYIKKNKVYEELAKDMMFNVMRHHFIGRGLKGEFCCPPCTLSLLPLYTCNCFKWANCRELRTTVLAAMKSRQSVFRRNYSARYAQWALGIK